MVLKIKNTKTQKRKSAKRKSAKAQQSFKEFQSFRVSAFGVRRSVFGVRRSFVCLFVRSFGGSISEFRCPIFGLSFVRSLTSLTSFLHSFVRSFVRSFVCWRCCSFLCSLTSFLPSFLRWLPSFVRWLTSFPPSMDPGFIRSLVRWTHNTVPRCIRSFPRPSVCLLTLSASTSILVMQYFATCRRSLWNESRARGLSHWKLNKNIGKFPWKHSRYKKLCSKANDLPESHSLSKQFGADRQRWVGAARTEIT